MPYPDSQLSMINESFDVLSSSSNLSHTSYLWCTGKDVYNTLVHSDWLIIHHHTMWPSELFEFLQPKTFSASDILTGLNFLGGYKLDHHQSLTFHSVNARELSVLFIMQIWNLDLVGLIGIIFSLIVVIERSLLDNIIPFVFSGAA